VYIYASRVDRSGAMAAQIDGQGAGTIDGSIGAPPDGSGVRTIIWARTGLSPYETHLLRADHAGAGSQGGPYSEIINVL
jgi:hypothetical protein